MQTIDAIIDKLGGPSALADALQLPVPTVSAWKHRNRIPNRYWPKLVKLGPKRGVKITYEGLTLASQPSEAA